MAIVLNLALLLVLGVLQVSCADSEEVQIGSKTYRPKCFVKTTAMYDGNSKSLWVLKGELAFKEEVIRNLQAIVAASHQCCGKESEEKTDNESEETKCIKEAILPSVQRIADMLSMYQNEYRGALTQTLTNISTLAAYSENEIDCCCHKKIDSGVAGLKLFRTSYNQNIKECEMVTCAHNLNWFMKQIPEFIDKMITAHLMQKQVLNDYESLEKIKEDVFQDVKCKDEKAMSTLKKAIRTLKLRCDGYLPKQMVLNWNIYLPMIQYARAAVRQMVECPTEIQLKQFRLF